MIKSTLKGKIEMRRILSKNLLFILIICIATVKLSAQTTNIGKISGVVIDAKTNEAVSFASAVLLDRKTKAIIKAVETDDNGAFALTNLPNGVYTFKVSYVGYQTMVRDSVAITTAVKEVNFGKINMKIAAGNLLNEVAITAPKPTMQMGIDKKIFAVDQSIVSEGGSASDLLQNVPSVQTDLDGNVSLRGSSGVKVLIDGKPSLIAGGNIAQILQSIPASSIESVELITNPSAKYDAEGQSGIINIVLKRNKKLGFNGSVALTGGNRDNYNANTSLSFQNKKINLYGNYSYRYGNRLGGGFNNILYFNSPYPTAYADQNNDSRSLDKGHNVKGGIDYYVAEKSVLSFSGGFNIRDNNRNEYSTINQFYANLKPLQLSNRNNINNGNGNSYDLNLDFSHKFKKPKEELNISFGFSQGNNDNLQTYATNVFNIDGATVNDIELQRNNGLGKNRNYNAQVDYNLPLGKFGQIEAGLRSQNRISDNNTWADTLNQATSEFDFNASLSNNFESKDQVHAVYFNYQNQIKNFGYQFGLRAEDASLKTNLGTYNNSQQLSYTQGEVGYRRLYPSVFLTQKLNADQQLQLSYSRRVNRPRGWDTNPFLDVSDPLNHRQGNSKLRAEDVHAFELGYSKYWKKFSIISSVYFRQTNDVIQRIRTEPDANGVTISIPQNLTRNTASGVELIGKYEVLRAWNFTANLNLYQSKIAGVPAFGIIENSGFSWNTNITNNFNLPHGITLQVKADYRAAEVMAQGKRDAMYGMDAGAKYNFKNKKSSLSLNIRDVFASRKWKMTTTGYTSTVDISRYMQGTMANLTYSYRFGKTDFGFKKAKKADDQGGRPDEETF